MQSYLLKNIVITDPNSEFHGQMGDLGIQDGIVKEFGISINEETYEKIIDFSNCLVSPSFIDLRCNSSEPGYEHRETFQSLNNCAMAGGFSHLALLPNCFPARQTASDIELVHSRTKNLPVQFLPLGAVTHDLDNSDLTEMYDMHQSGAVAFSNGNKAIEDIGTMSRAMQYSKSFKGIIHSYCEQKQLSKGAYVAEGTVAVSLGLKGIPQMAEYLQVQRDIELAEYHQTRIHLSKVSTEKSVELVRQAKAQGVQVTCDVAIMNLVLTDEAIMDFDSNLKLSPPLRQASDVKALWEGLKDGTIDAICSDHHPQEIERKAVEFEYAAFGSIALQILLSLAIEGRNRFCKDMSDEAILLKITQGPSEVLDIPNNKIEIGSKALLCIINPNKQTKLNTKNNHSGSKNTYYMDKPLPYFIEATFIGKNSLFNQ
jgi:dihydroorotase